jgi:hypothetical protein
MHRLRTPLRTLNQITLPVGHTAATARQHTGPSRRAREHEPSGMGAQLGSKSGRNMPLARPVRGRPWKPTVTPTARPARTLSAYLHRRMTASGSAVGSLTVLGRA